MIVTEHKLRDIVAQMPTIQINADTSVKPKFGWGHKKELNRYLLKKPQNWFPLVWLLPNRETHTEQGQRVERNCSIVICTQETRLELYNDERYLISYDLVLNILSDYVIQGLKGSSITDIIGDYDIFKEPNYSDSEAANESGAIELIDATRIDCNVRFNDECLKKIKWQTIQ